MGQHGYTIRGSAVGSLARVGDLAPTTNQLIRISETRKVICRKGPPAERKGEVASKSVNGGTGDLTVLREKV
jgi:hypothetical protein